MENNILSEIPFIAVDYINPCFDKIFDRDLLKEVDVITNEYTDEVFLFDVKEVRIKYFFSTKTMIKKGKKETETETTTIVFTDETEVLCRCKISEFMNGVFIEYLQKLSKYYPAVE
jgi:hypothetical protein